MFVIVAGSTNYEALSRTSPPASELFHEPFATLGDAVHALCARYPRAVENAKATRSYSPGIRIFKRRTMRFVKRFDVPRSWMNKRSYEIFELIG